MVKVLTLVGTRPELIKMSRVINELDKHFNHILVHSGQNYDYELNQIFFDDLEIRKPNYFLGISKKSTIKSIADIITKIDNVFDIEKPDAFLIYGDTNTSLSVIAAKKRKIPIFHMEAGNRCYDARVPEEINRKVVDHVSDVNLVLSEQARRNLLQENIKPDMIFKTGSHMKEVIEYYSKKIEKSNILKSLKLDKKKYFLVSAHREENVDNKYNLEALLCTLNALAKEYNYRIIITTHPRTRKKLEEQKDFKKNKMIEFLNPFSFTDYLMLQKSALCVLSDSGTITEETALLGLSSVTIRETHERQEGMDSGVLIMSGLKSKRVLESIKIIIKQNNQKQKSKTLVQDYENNIFVSKQITRIVISYIDYVNDKIWSKNK